MADDLEDTKAGRLPVFPKAPARAEKNTSAASPVRVVAEPKPSSPKREPRRDEDREQRPTVRLRPKDRP